MTNSLVGDPQVAVVDVDGGAESGKSLDFLTPLFWQPLIPLSKVLLIRLKMFKATTKLRLYTGWTMRATSGLRARRL